MFQVIVMNKERNPMKMRGVVLTGATVLGLMLGGCASGNGVTLETGALDNGGSATAVVLPDGTGATAAPATEPVVAVYFGERPHPAIARYIGRTSRAARVARRGNGSAVPCDQALAAALHEMRMDAVEHGANAVINVNTYFHTIGNNSAAGYTCNLSARTAVVDVKGELVVLQTPSITDTGETKR
ncbi:signal peptidase [Paraburkholderia acidisoli]|uniref:Signal peptidase n=1 Tax=Paraburkholderia acidisoli TaxID=2571748 RepID=A0A7Z2GMM8_9BURK|nr:signal peptidase [Paraburkholderia acidisoli]QGZ64606.1 signal peptidase [Paraburkholderia acidisoli]